MRKLTLSVLASTALILGAGAGAGYASADPLQDLTPLIDTTCNYDQVIAGINDLDPGLGQEVADFPPAAGRLQQFLALPNDQRQGFVDSEVNAHPRAMEILDAIEGDPGGQDDLAILTQVSQSCSKYPANPGPPPAPPAPAA